MKEIDKKCKAQRPYNFFFSFLLLFKLCGVVVVVVNLFEKKITSNLPQQYGLPIQTQYNNKKYKKKRITTRQIRSNCKGCKHY